MREVFVVRRWGVRVLEVGPDEVSRKWPEGDMSGIERRRLVPSLMGLLLLAMLAPVAVWGAGWGEEE